MRSLSELIRLKKQIRVIGFDDAPFEKIRGAKVNVSGMVCSNTRFEGMLWAEAHKDGDDATDVIINMLKNSKFYSQVNLIITDGIAIGGFNIIDLPRLAKELERPCIAVMRKQPNLEKIEQALTNFDDKDRRWGLVKAAGEIFTYDDFVYQVAACEPIEAGQALAQLTDNGKVPEALRLAHIIGSAIKTGQSSNRA